MSLSNKVVVITGGNKGLGKNLATKMSEEGCKVITCSRSDSKNNVDVSNEKQVSDFTKHVVQKFGRIDIWINNAGIWIPHTPIEKTDWKRVHEMIEVNLFGTVYGSKESLIQMKKQGHGIIINILSTSALEGRSGSSGYCASKYAATGFTKSLRKEAPVEIKVISIYPGGMQTNFFDEEKPENYMEYMNPSLVADKIIQNLKKENPDEELIIKRDKSEES